MPNICCFSLLFFVLYNRKLSVLSRELLVGQNKTFEDVILATFCANIHYLFMLILLFLLSIMAMCFTEQMPMIDN